MRTPRRILGSLFITLLLGGSMSLAGDHLRSSKLARPDPLEFERWLGAEAWAVLNAIDDFQVFALRRWAKGGTAERTSESTGSLPPGTPLDIWGYPVYAVSKENPIDIARRLASLILDKKSYSPKGLPFSGRFIKGCASQPDVAFRLSSGRKAVVVLIDFSCDQIDIGSVPGIPRAGTGVKGDIDPSRGAFLALVKRALPDVEEIARIPEIRRPETRKRGSIPESHEPR